MCSWFGETSDGDIPSPRIDWARGVHRYKKNLFAPLLSEVLVSARVGFWLDEKTRKLIERFASKIIRSPTEVYYSK